MPQITPFLWFDDQAEQAMEFYTSIFDDSRIEHIERYPDESLDPHFAGMTGKVITGSFRLRGRPFLCLDGGPEFQINPSISFFCTFDDRATIESTWRRLSQDGKVLMEFQAYPWSPAYGWLQDRYGVSWQLALATDNPPPQPITPLLMFTGPTGGRAEQAMRDYTTLFEDSGIDTIAPYEEADPDTPGLVKHARFHLGDNHFMAMDSTLAHDFTFNEGVSLFVSCQDQAEIDRYWNTLTADGGEEGQCGWCKDRFGVSWQVTPANIGQLLSAGPGAVQALMRMQKIDIAELERAGHSQ
ncbi:MAG TPA: VOC family protein [Kineosporiaceae bacterium]|nr:VOC family protein [Kineosporiaceae bacterium]